MKVFEFAGIIFNADNICTIQKVIFKGEKERDEKYNRLLIGLEKL